MMIAATAIEHDLLLITNNDRHFKHIKDLKYYQDIIKKKRKTTDFRDFLMEIGSWYSMVFYRDEN